MPPFDHFIWFTSWNLANLAIWHLGIRHNESLGFESRIVKLATFISIICIFYVRAASKCYIYILEVLCIYVYISIFNLRIVLIEWLFPSWEIICTNLCQCAGSTWFFFFFGISQTSSRFRCLGRYIHYWKINKIWE